MKKKALKRLLKDALQQLAAARQPAPVDEGPTLAAWLPTYRAILAQRGYHPQTVKNRSSSLKHVEAVWGERPLRAIKPHEIAAKLRLFTPATAVRLLGELRDLYGEAIANGAADTSPAAHVKPPKHPGLRKRLPLAVWQRMLTLARTGPQRWVPAMLMLAMATGQRRADLARMRFDDVVDGFLRVEQQKKAGKPIGARLAIPLTLKVRALGMTLGEVIEHCRTIGKPGPTLLRKAGGGAIEMSSLSARFHECIVATEGADAYQQYEWPSLHEVRSLCGRTLIAEGMTPAQVQSLLGHKHADMTAVYLDDRGLSAAEWKRVSLPELEAESA